MTSAASPSSRGRSGARGPYRAGRRAILRDLVARTRRRPHRARPRPTRRGRADRAAAAERHQDPDQRVPAGRGLPGAPDPDGGLRDRAVRRGRARARRQRDGAARRGRRGAAGHEPPLGEPDRGERADGVHPDRRAVRTPNCSARLAAACSAACCTTRCTRLARTPRTPRTPEEAEKERPDGLRTQRGGRSSSPVPHAAKGPPRRRSWCARGRGSSALTSSTTTVRPSPSGSRRPGRGRWSTGTSTCRARNSGRTWRHAWPRTGPACTAWSTTRACPTARGCTTWTWRAGTGSSRST